MIDEQFKSGCQHVLIDVELNVCLTAPDTSGDYSIRIVRQCGKCGIHKPSYTRIGDYTSTLEVANEIAGLTGVPYEPPF